MLAKRAQEEGGRKKEANSKSKVDTEAIAKVRDQLAESDFIPPSELSDVELGCEGLIKIMPDTWKNISWVISHSIE